MCGDEKRRTEETETDEMTIEDDPSFDKSLNDLRAIKSDRQRVARL